MGRGKCINILLCVLQHSPEPPRPRWINQLLPDELQQGCLSWVTALHHSCYSGDLCCIALHHPSLPGETSVTSINAALQNNSGLGCAYTNKAGWPSSQTNLPATSWQPYTSTTSCTPTHLFRSVPGYQNRKPSLPLLMNSSPVPFGMALRKWAEGIFLFSPCLWLSAFFYFPFFSLKKQPYFCNLFTEKTHTAVWINTGLKIGIKTS